MIFDVLTLFPELINNVIRESIIGRALEKGIIKVNAINIRDFSNNKHKKVDDYPYGGGVGMLMTPQPVYDAHKSIIEKLDYKPKCIFLSPKGKIFDQEMAKRLKEENHIIILCGHYEGIDQRVLDEIVDEEISIGDFVLTGGELPALSIIDCISRLVPGVLGAENGYQDDSLYNGTLECSQYTRPNEFKGKSVPEILMSGHHDNIRKWKRKESLLLTYVKRPDLFVKLVLSKEDIILIQDDIDLLHKIKEKHVGEGL